MNWITSFLFFYSAVSFANDQVPVVQVEKLELTELFDEVTYPARVTSKVQAAITADMDGVVVKVLAPLGHRVARGGDLFMIKNTDPVYEYVPVKVTSPVAGVVSNLEVAEGTMVRKGQKLGTVVDPTQIVVEIEVPASDLAIIHRDLAGQVMAGEKNVVAVKVNGVSPVVDPLTGTASAQLRLTSGTLPIGVIGKAIFKANARKAIQVSDQALIYRGNDTLLRLVEDSKAKFVPVKVTSTRKGFAEIGAGIPAGSTVIVRASRYVAEGQQVSVQQSDVAKK